MLFEEAVLNVGLLVVAVKLAWINSQILVQELEWHWLLKAFVYAIELTSVFQNRRNNSAPINWEEASSCQLVSERLRYPKLK